MVDGAIAVGREIFNQVIFRNFSGLIYNWYAFLDLQVDIDVGVNKAVEAVV